MGIPTDVETSRVGSLLILVGLKLYEISYLIQKFDRWSNFVMDSCIYSIGVLTFSLIPTLERDVITERTVKLSNIHFTIRPKTTVWFRGRVVFISMLKLCCFSPVLLAFVLDQLKGLVLSFSMRKLGISYCVPVDMFYESLNYHSFWLISWMVIEYLWKKTRSQNCIVHKTIITKLYHTVICLFSAQSGHKPPTS